PTTVAGGESDERGARRIVDRDVATKPARVRDRAVDEQRDVVVGERLQGQQQGTRQQRRDDGERRVLRRGGDEDDPPVLDAGEERVLLRLREAMDLIEEEDRGLAVQVALGDRLLHHLSDVLHTRGDRRELDEAATRGT